MSDKTETDKPLSYCAGVLCDGMKQVGIIGYSVSPAFEALLAERLPCSTNKVDANKLCGKPVLNAYGLSCGVIIHYSDGGALWWRGDDAPPKVFLPTHLAPVCL